MVLENREPEKLTEKRIIVIDDHPIVSEGLKSLIRHEKDLVVCGHTENAYEAVSDIKKMKPDIIIVDISLKEMNGLELIKKIRINYPKGLILVLSMHDEKVYAERTLKAGVKGYLMKQQSAKSIITAIREILNGQLYISDQVRTRLMNKLVKGRLGDDPEIDRLSNREFEVFLLIRKGHGTHQISNQLHLNTKTVESHRRNIKIKLGLKDSVQLLKYAFQWANR